MAISRWQTPKRYPCAHAGCPTPARITARSGAHAVTDADGSTSTKAHNCCGSHGASPSAAQDQA